MDAQLGRVEIHRLASDPDVPEVVSAGAFDWRPAEDGPELSIHLDELFSDLD